MDLEQRVKTLERNQKTLTTLVYAALTLALLAFVWGGLL